VPFISKFTVAEDKLVVDAGNVISHAPVVLEDGAKATDIAFSSFVAFTKDEVIVEYTLEA
jgi:hypothetical protein